MLYIEKMAYIQGEIFMWAHKLYKEHSRVASDRTETTMDKDKTSEGQDMRDSIASDS